MRIQVLFLWTVLNFIPSFAPASSRCDDVHGKAWPFLQVWRSGLENHLRIDGDGTYQVLLPRNDRSIEVQVFRDQEAAEKTLISIDRPLNLEGWIDKVRNHENELRDDLNRIQVLDASLNIESGVKSVRSLREKLFNRSLRSQAQGRSYHLDQPNDLIRGRVIARTEKQMERVADQIRDILGDRLTDFELKSQTIGFNAYHFKAKTAAGVPFEIQLLTQRMLAAAQWEHGRVYKSKLGLSDPTYQKRLEAYAAQVYRYVNDLDQGRPDVILPDTKGIRQEDFFRAF